MRFVKLAVISVVIIFSLFTCIGLFLPSSVTVTRTENINASLDTVRLYTNEIRNWKYWLINDSLSPVKLLNEKQMQSGDYNISVIENEPKQITVLWQHENGKERRCRIKLEEISFNNTLVYLSFEQHLSWLPWERIGGMLHDEIIGPSMQTSLDKLKMVVEKTSE
ncbi:MAG TPA: hypothetical protein VHB70_17500 [Parafilimonas sp.]|nr:hypothetical protein [Parafilimonas sp.]